MGTALCEHFEAGSRCSSGRGDCISRGCGPGQAVACSRPLGSDKCGGSAASPVFAPAFGACCSLSCAFSMGTETEPRLHSFSVNTDCLSAVRDMWRGTPSIHVELKYLA